MIVRGPSGPRFPLNVKVMTEEITGKKRSRRKRRSKAEIEAEKAAKAAEALEIEAKEAEGLERVRARDDAGHFVKDDPATPENEAWEWRKPEEVVKTPIVEPEPIPTEPDPEEPVVEEEVVASEPAPIVEEPVQSEPVPPPAPVPAPAPAREAKKAVSYGGESKIEEIGCRFKRRRAQRRSGQ